MHAHNLLPELHKSLEDIDKKAGKTTAVDSGYLVSYDVHNN